ncbi:MAG: hypothetical protein JWN19_2877 [Arthrobacter sp.]|jgi:hypothetical protein|nr:hypothetical protein [Arthrobacter sp.]
MLPSISPWGAVAITGEPAAEAGAAFRFGAPIVGPEHPKDVWRAGLL